MKPRPVRISDRPIAVRSSRLDGGARAEERGYLDQRIGFEVLSIVVGGCVVSGRADVVITTTLGSCVAVCLFDADAGVGGMNHFLLADAADDRLSASARYGSAAMEQLINRMLQLTGRRDRLRAKVFGGGKVTSQLSAIGSRNIEFVMDYLACEGIPTIGWDVGGSQARAIRFFPVTGRSQRRLIGDGSSSSEIGRSEAQFIETIRNTRIEGDVELF